MATKTSVKVSPLADRVVVRALEEAETDLRRRVDRGEPGLAEHGARVRGNGPTLPASRRSRFAGNVQTAVGGSSGLCTSGDVSSQDLNHHTNREAP